MVPKGKCPTEWVATCNIQAESCCSWSAPLTDRFNLLEAWLGSSMHDKEFCQHPMAFEWHAAGWGAFNVYDLLSKTDNLDVVVHCGMA